MNRPTYGKWMASCGAIYVDLGDNLDCRPDVRLALIDRDEPKTRPDERDANARLMAAAPELLEALERLNLQCARLRLPRTDDLDDLIAAKDAAWAAIAKAKGEA